jgi:hypothetical protein
LAQFSGFHSSVFWIRHRVGQLAGAVLIALSVFVLCGGHWGVFQAVAWVQMIHDYSRSASLAEAVGRTLSGEAPCSLCHTIQTEKKKETRAPISSKVDKKAEGFLVVAARDLPRPLSRLWKCDFPDDEFFDGPTRDPVSPVPIV